MNKIPTTQVNQIPTTQLNNIPTTQVNQIPTTKLNKIPTTQVKQIPTTQLNKIPTTQINQSPTTMIHTTIVKQDTQQIKEKVFFFLQVQIINGKIYIFLLINFQITKNTKFIFSLTIYLSRNLRNLEENAINKEVTFYPKENNDGNGDKITSLVSDEEVSDSRVVINGLKNADDIEVKVANDNSDLLDAQKVEEIIKKGGVNFSEIEENGNNYTISNYKVLSSSSGCEFSLTSESKISQSNKNIELNFKEIQNNNNIIQAKCILSSQNDKKIICNLDKEINSYYILEPYFFSDKTEAIIIYQKDTNDNLPLLCKLTETSTDQKDPTNPTDPTYPSRKPKKDGGLSVGVIVGIIAGIIVVAVAIIVTVIICKKKCSKNKKNEVPVDSKVEQYQSTTSDVYI